MRPDDVRWMGRAIELACNGFAAPNPHVGCVLVRDGRIAGEGHSAAAGGPHAEIRALEAAGEQAQGSTAYVTLEPCNHHGRTGPCSDALVTAGVKRVVYGVADPNSKAGGGAERLKSAGIEVLAGVREEECQKVHKRFLGAMRLGRPWVTVKSAVTLDGKTAWPDGTSQWITGPEAREDGHWFRAALGCVLVGRRTVAYDNPRLTARIEGVERQPLRVVLDPSGRLDGSEAVFGEGEWVWLREPGENLQAEQTVLDSLEPMAVLQFLWERGMTGVLIEGGAATVRRFFEVEAVDELVLYVAPKVFGDGLDWLGRGQAWLPDGKALRLDELKQVGQDFRAVYEFLR